MNLFRFLGDLSHLLAIILLLLKIWKTRSCAGERPAQGKKGQGGGRPRAGGGWEPQGDWFLRPLLGGESLFRPGVTAGSASLPG